MSYSIYAYPWNLSTAGYQQVINDIEKIGLKGINLTVSYHAGKFIHPQNRQHRVYFPEDGVVYFEPRAIYGRIKPVVSETLNEQDILALLTRQESVLVNAWTVLLHNTRLGMLYPEATVKNAFGNAYVYSLCPANPDVREYALTLCQDIATHYSINTLLLETPGFLAYSHGYHHEFAQIKPNMYFEALLGLCFCDHCRNGAKQAGINIELLQQQVVISIDSYLSTDQPPGHKTAAGWLEEDITTDPELNAFLQWRCDVVTSLIRDIRMQTPDAIKVKIITTTQASHTSSVLEGHHLQALAEVSDGLEIPVYQPSLDKVDEETAYLSQIINDISLHSVILRPGWPDMQSQTQLIDTLERIHALNINEIAFYNYDMLLPSNLRWLKNAINYFAEVSQ